jgi:hypothetical protein
MLGKGTGMGAIVYKIGKRGLATRATVVPANHSEETHFGVADALVVGFLLLCVGCLIGLLVLLH